MMTRYSAGLFLALGMAVFAEERADGVSKGSEEGTGILDIHSYWRGFAVCSPPVQARTAEESKVAEAVPGMPTVPADWAGPDFSDGAWRRCSIRRKIRRATYEIEILNPRGVEHGVISISVDGKACANGRVPFFADGVHQVRVTLGRHGKNGREQGALP